MIFHIEARLSDSPYVERVWRAQGEHPGTFVSHQGLLVRDPVVEAVLRSRLPVLSRRTI